MFSPLSFLSSPSLFSSSHHHSPRSLLSLLSPLTTHNIHLTHIYCTLYLVSLAIIYNSTLISSTGKHLRNPKWAPIQQWLPPSSSSSLAFAVSYVSHLPRRYQPNWLMDAYQKETVIAYMHHPQQDLKMKGAKNQRRINSSMIVQSIEENHQHSGGMILNIQ